MPEKLIEKRGNLRNKRIQQGLTQSMLGNAVGVSTEHIKSLEYGRVNPSFKLMLKICEVLKGKPDELF